MWRWLVLVLLVVVLSAAAAWVSMTMAPTHMSSSTPFPVGTSDRAASSGPQPKVRLDVDPNYDFGVMAQQTKGRREWVVHNDGAAVLKLTGTQPACSCTVIDPKPDQEVQIQPGQSFTVKIEWETRQFVDHIEKNARVLTNDPARPDINFIVSGEVHPAILTEPPDGVLDVRNLPNDEPHEFHAGIYSPDRPDLKILSMQTTRPELLDVSYEERERTLPMKPTGHAAAGAEMPPGDAAKPAADGLKVKAYEVKIVVKPTPILGTFREEIIVKTDHPLRDELRFTVVGRVLGPIAVTPPNGVRMIDVSGPKGGHSFVTLTVRGQESTEFKVAHAPAKFEVKVTPFNTEEPAPASGAGATAAVKRYRVDVTVPAGSQPAVIDDPIRLETNHPLAKEVEVPLHVRILGGN